MKVASILVTAALAVGTGAFAQTRDGGGESVGQKADRIFDRMENATKRGIDKVRGTGNKAKNEVENKEARRDVKRDDTRAMGAGKADKMAERNDQRAGSGDRQARIDDAYGNWKNQQKR